MFFRLATLSICALFVGCNNSFTPSDARDVYASALLELAPAISHFTIEAEKVKLGTGGFVPDMERISEYGMFSFADSNGIFTEGDFLGLDVTLLSDRDLEELSSDDCETFWRNFRTKHTQSTGLIRISDVGFNENGTEAIFYLEGAGGCLAGAGMLILMKRQGGRWVVAQREELWVS